MDSLLMYKNTNIVVLLQFIYLGVNVLKKIQRSFNSAIKIEFFNADKYKLIKINC